MKEFKYLKKHKALSKEKEASVNENVLVVNDGELFKVSKVVDVPKKLVNAVIKKAKEESGKDPKIFWNDVSVADEIVKYIINTHLDIDSLPASILMGDTALGANAEVEVEDGEGVEAEEGEEANIPDDLELDDDAAEGGEGEEAEAAEGEEAAGEDVPSLDSEDSEGGEAGEEEAEEAEDDLED
jgi:hypothetical protein